MEVLEGWQKTRAEWIPPPVFFIGCANEQGQTSWM